MAVGRGGHPLAGARAVGRAPGLDPLARAEVGASGRVDPGQSVRWTPPPGAMRGARGPLPHACPTPPSARGVGLARTIRVARREWSEAGRRGRPRRAAPRENGGGAATVFGAAGRPRGRGRRGRQGSASSTRPRRQPGWCSTARSCGVRCLRSDPGSSSPSLSPFGQNFTDRRKRRSPRHRRFLEEYRGLLVSRGDWI